MENTQNSKQAIAEMNWLTENSIFIDYRFANTDYVHIPRLYTGGSNLRHAGDALRTAGNWPHILYSRLRHDSAKWKRCH